MSVLKKTLSFLMSLLLVALTACSNQAQVNDYFDENGEGGQSDPTEQTVLAEDALTAYLAKKNGEESVEDAESVVNAENAENAENVENVESAENVESVENVESSESAQVDETASEKTNDETVPTLSEEAIENGEEEKTQTVAEQKKEETVENGKKEGAVPKKEPSKSPSIDLNKYLIVWFEGKNGRGKATAILDKEQFYLDNIDIVKFKSDSAARAYESYYRNNDGAIDAFWRCVMSVQIEDNGRPLSNGDVVTVKWAYNEKRASNYFDEFYTYRNQDFVVNGLEGPDPSEDMTADVSDAQLNRGDFTLSRGEKFTVKLSGTTAAPQWDVDDPNVAVVNENGVVTGVGGGTTTLHCKVGDRDLTCIVRVK